MRLDLSAHYESYKESMEKDLLEGAIAYGKTLPTARTDLYPTVTGYIKVAAAGIKHAIASNDEAAYRAWIEGHQQAMLGLLKRHVQTAGLEPLDLISKKGWRWWRFTDEQIRCHGVSMLWVPRRDAEVNEPCFDAEELEYIFKLKDETFTQNLLKEKQQRAVKFLPKTGELIDSKSINVGRINDWTLPLFEQGGTQ